MLWDRATPLKPERAAAAGASTAAQQAVLELMAEGLNDGAIARRAGLEHHHRPAAHRGHHEAAGCFQQVRCGRGGAAEGMDRVGPVKNVGYRRPASTVTSRRRAVVAGVAALLHVQRREKTAPRGDGGGDGQVHAEALVAEHRPAGTDLGGVDAQERQDQAGRDRDRGHEPDGDGVADAAVLIRAALGALDRGQLRATIAYSAVLARPGVHAELTVTGLRILVRAFSAVSSAVGRLCRYFSVVEMLA